MSKATTPKATTSPATKKAHKSTGCKGMMISFTTKRGREVQFEGKAGKSCLPRKTSSSKNSRAVREIFADASKQCGKLFGYFTKESGRCVKDAFKSNYTPKRAR